MLGATPPAPPTVSRTLFVYMWQADFSESRNQKVKRQVSELVKNQVGKNLVGNRSANLDASSNFAEIHLTKSDSKLHLVILTTLL